MTKPADLDPSTYEHIELEIADGIATIWMNRPDNMSTFTELMRYEIIDALDHTDADDDVRAVIFTRTWSSILCWGRSVIGRRHLLSRRLRHYGAQWCAS